MKTCLFFACSALLLGLSAQAGTLADGKWSATNCGTLPPSPEIDDSGVEAYNASLKAVKAWQQAAQAYANCVVGEANADNEAIAKAANAEQERFKAAVAEISAAAKAAKAKLDRQ